MFWLQYIVSLKKIKIQNKNCEIKHAIWSSGVVKHHMERKKNTIIVFFLNHNKNNQKKIDNVIVSKFDKLTWGDYRSKHTTCFVSWTNITSTIEKTNKYARQTN